VKGDGNMARKTQYPKAIPARFKEIPFADMEKYADLENVDKAEYIRQAVDYLNAKMKKKHEGKKD
jgi:hypothetical protein